MSKATNAATKEQLVSLMEYISQNISIPTIGIGGGYAPIGTIISYMGTTAPQDYLVCDGSTYNIANYPQLSSFFNRQFGSSNFFGGDGVTTFKVPDLRGEFLRGTGTNSHENQGSGATVGTHQDATKHQYISTDTTGSVIYASAPITQMSNYDNRVYSGTEQKRVGTTSLSDLTNQVQNFTSRPTNTSVLYCIKAVVAGDVYSTDERVVGTWIDGKPLYQKTVDCGALTTKAVAHNISNIDSIVYIQGFATTGSAAMPLPYVNTDNIQYGVQIDVSTTHIGLGVKLPSFNTYNGYVTLQYTKTTD